MATDLKIISLLFSLVFSYIYIYFFSFLCKLRDQIPNTLDSNEWKSEFKSSHSREGNGIGRGKEGGGGGKRNHLTLGETNICTPLARWPYNLRQQDQTPRETTRETWNRGNRTTRRAKRPTPTTRLVSCFSSPRSVFEENETRYVILFITAKCKRWPRKGAERNINTERTDLVCVALRSLVNVRMYARLENCDESRSV